MELGSSIEPLSQAEFDELQAFADSSRLFSPVTARVVELAERLNIVDDPAQNVLRQKLSMRSIDELSACFFVSV